MEKKTKITARRQAESDIREALREENKKNGTSKCFLKFRKECEFEVPMRFIVVSYLREQRKKK